MDSAVLVGLLLAVLLDPFLWFLAGAIGYFSKKNKTSFDSMIVIGVVGGLIFSLIVNVLMQEARGGMSTPFSGAVFVIRSICFVGAVVVVNRFVGPKTTEPS